RRRAGASRPCERRRDRPYRRLPARSGGLGNPLSRRRYGRLVPGKKVLVAPQWMQEIDWPDRAIYCELSRGEVQSSPEFGPARPFEREAEERLHRHYRKPGYWLP